MRDAVRDGEILTLSLKCRALELQTTTTYTIMDSNPSEPLMELPISIEQDSLRYDTSVLINSYTILNFVGRYFLNRNDLVGKCTCGSKTDDRIPNEQRIFTADEHFPTMIYVGTMAFLGLKFHVLSHLKYADLIFCLPAMTNLHMFIQLPINLVLFGDSPFLYESQPRRVSCTFVDSSEM